MHASFTRSCKRSIRPRYNRFTGTLLYAKKLVGLMGFRPGFRMLLRFASVELQQPYPVCQGKRPDFVEISRKIQVNPCLLPQSELTGQSIGNQTDPVVVIGQ